MCNLKPQFLGLIADTALSRTIPGPIPPSPFGIGMPVGTGYSKSHLIDQATSLIHMVRDKLKVIRANASSMRTGLAAIALTQLHSLVMAEVIPLKAFRRSADKEVVSFQRLTIPESTIALTGYRTLPNPATFGLLDLRPESILYWRERSRGPHT